MFKWLGVLLLVISVMGCSNISSNNGMSVNKPPKSTIEIGNKSYETTLGTYCWHHKGKGECVDKVGPVELLKDQKPVNVHPGEKITFKMDYEPKPNEIHIEQINKNNSIEIPVKDNSFFAPNEKGIYYYSYGVWWMDEKEKNVSNGDAFYAFVIKVK
ncbi:hypothetical protein [Heyndrickxia sporothermodurans]|uniref:hypothetical protein n=1 Tax=Heyndrickxia sporothermodurans TaxID=46224 RepID=UPI001FD0F510|nr:hypothetical protein [Heyndrickxia sporothermodurans]